MKSYFTDPKSSRIANIILAILLLSAGIFMALYARDDDSSSAYLTFHNEGYLTLRDNQNTTYEVRYTDILDLSYIENPDYGQSVTGSITDDHVMLGLWQSDSLGEYIVVADDRIAACVVIETAEGRYVINKENAETTAAILDAIRDAQARLQQET